MTKQKFIRISPEFHSYLQAHGRYGETMEAIILRVGGDNFKVPTGDRPTKVYSKEDVDSKKTKRALKTGGKE